MDEIVDAAQFGVEFEANVGHCGWIGSLAAQHILKLDALGRHVQIQISNALHNF